MSIWGVGLLLPARLLLCRRVDEDRWMTRQRSALSARRRILLSLWGVWGTTLLLGTLGLTGAAHAQTVTAASARRVLWGASMANPAPWKWGPVRNFERTTGKRVSLISFGLPFEHCGRGCHTYPFPAPLMSKIRRHGAVPVISWSSASAPMSLSEPAFTDRQIANGRYDRYIRRFAEAARRWRYPFFLRFDWEMNGNWFPWGIGINGNRTADFVAAWRHVHHIFREVGAKNVSWLWCPNVGNWASLYRLYPGRNDVDWTCLDGYNWGTTGPGSPGASRGGFLQFNTIYSAAYATVTRHIAPNKPMMLGEVGSNDHGGSESAWIARMFQELPTQFPKIQGLMWYQVNDTWDFPLRAGTPAGKAFAAGIKASRYAPNYFCHVFSLSPAQLARVPPTSCKG